MDTFEIFVSAVLQQLPEDARDEKNRGTEYIIDCPCCDGKIHVVHSLYNGHMRAKCDKCEFLMFE